MLRAILCFVAVGCQEPISKSDAPSPLEGTSVGSTILEPNAGAKALPMLSMELDELLIGRQAEGAVIGTRVGDRVSIYVGAGYATNACEDEICLDLAQPDLIESAVAYDDVPFVFFVPADAAPEDVFIFQAIVWDPSDAEAYKSDTLEATARHLQWISVAAGAQHTCAVSEEGRGACWGTNLFTRQAVVGIPRRDDFVQVSSASNHNVALLENGTAVGWGENGWGQADTHRGPFVQVCGGGFHSCGRSALGVVDCWGMNVQHQADVPPGLIATDLACGFQHTCAITLMGRRVCWGSWADGTFGATDGIAVTAAAGDTFTCSVDVFQAVSCFGHESWGELASPEDLLATNLAADNHTACGVDAGGDIRCWGDDSSGQAPDRVSGPFAGVEVGGQHTCGLSQDGALLCWGDDTYSQVSAPWKYPR